MRDLFMSFLGYRLHIPILTFLILMNEFRGGPSYEMTLLSIAFALGIAGWYLSNKYSDWHEDNLNTASIPVKRSGILLWSFLSCYILPLLYLWRFPDLAILYVVALIIFGNLYNFPVPGAKKRFKDLFIIKNVVASAVWSAVFALAPAIYAGTFGDVLTWITYLTFFIIVMSIEIFTDIRDVDGDKKSGVATIPSLWGITTARVLCFALIATAAIKSLLIGSGNLYFLGAYAASALLIIFADKKRGAVYFQSMIFVWIIAEFLFLIFR